MENRNNNEGKLSAIIAQKTSPPVAFKVSIIDDDYYACCNYQISIILVFSKEMICVVCYVMLYSFNPNLTIKSDKKLCTPPDCLIHRSRYIIMNSIVLRKLLARRGRRKVSLFPRFYPLVC